MILDFESHSRQGIIVVPTYAKHACYGSIKREGQTHPGFLKYVLPSHLYKWCVLCNKKRCCCIKVCAIQQVLLKRDFP